jgi:hypothetical protein
MPTFKHKIAALALGLSSVFTVYADDNTPLISVTSPAYCSEIIGDTTINISAPGLHSVTVKSWKPGGQFGSQGDLGTVSLDSDGKGSIDFPASQYPHGPITITISGKKGADFDNCHLQLYNKAGIPWNEGIPREDPKGAEGMQLVYADDFNGAPSISTTNMHAKYYDHKPPHGSQDFSSIPFTDFESPNNPFAQMDGYLRIRADLKKHSSGLISSENDDAEGFTCKAPCYFECRMIGPTAKGTWPAWWLMTDYPSDDKRHKDMSKVGVDELDIIEAYGGEGRGEPDGNGERNFLYMITPHAWNQGDKGKELGDEDFKMLHNPADMKKHGIPSTWYEAMHTYGCKITETETTYYCDNIEMGRHPTLPVSKKEPFFFLINLATGGGWPVDISRYGKVDMYVDFVRVYAMDKSQAKHGNR